MLLMAKIFSRRSVENVRGKLVELDEFCLRGINKLNDYEEIIENNGEYSID